MNGGIDQQVKRAMLSSRGNPQQLMQNYKQSNSLIDLLAMQKMKSEKEAAARDMQAKMKPNPDTIVEQREKELMGINRQELLNKMGPTMQRQAAQQPRPPMPPGGPNPAASGIAPAAPKMPPAQFSGGGIVSFQEGGDVDLYEKYGQEGGTPYRDVSGDTVTKYSDEETEGLIKKQVDAALATNKISPEALLKKLEEDDINSTGAMYLRSKLQDKHGPGYEKHRIPRKGPKVVDNSKKKKSGIASVKEASDGKTDWSKEQPLMTPEQRAIFQGSGTGTGGPNYRGRKVNRDNVYFRDQDIPPAEQTGAPVAPKSIPDVRQTGAPVPPKINVPEKGGIASILHKPFGVLRSDGNPVIRTSERLPEPEPEPQGGGGGGGSYSSSVRGSIPDTWSPERRAVYEAMMERAKRDPNIRKQEERAQAQQDLAGMLAKMGEKEKNRKGLQSLMAAQDDPRKRAYERLLAFGTGAANRSGFGSTMAGGSAASEAARAGQEGLSRENLKTIDSILDQEVANEKDYGGSVYDAGATAYDKSEQVSDSALQGAGTVVNAEMRDKVLAAANQLNAETNRITRSAMDQEAKFAKLTAINTQLKDIQKTINDQFNDRFDIQRLNMEMAKATRDNNHEDAIKIRNKIASERRAFEGQFGGAIDSLRESQRQLHKMLGIDTGMDRLGGGSGRVVDFQDL